jgi:hypothetical protein
MSDFDRTREFVQEYAYVEDYSLFYFNNEPSNNKEELDENRRGIVEIDLNNGQTIEII